jgi:predicted O-methyltransferase YrrM
MAYKKADNIPGLIDNELGKLLKDYASDVPEYMCIVEVGPFTGKSTVFLATGAHESVVVYTYDLWQANKRPISGGGTSIAKDRKHSFELFQDNIKKAGVQQRVFVTNADSAEMGRKWPNYGAAHIGLIYIDGDHRYPGIKADIEAWLPKLAPGAPAIFDDYSGQGVKRAVDEWCANKGWSIVDTLEQDGKIRAVVIQEDKD